MFFARLPLVIGIRYLLYLHILPRPPSTCSKSKSRISPELPVYAGRGGGFRVIFTRPNYRTARNELAGGDMFHSGIVLHAEPRPETITTIGLRFVKRRAANIPLLRRVPLFELKVNCILIVF